MQIKKGEKEIIIGCLLLIVFLVGITFLKWKDLELSSSRLSPFNEMNFPVFSDYFTESDKKEITDLYFLFKEMAEEKEYSEKSLKEGISFQYPAKWKTKIPEENTKEKIQVLFSAKPKETEDYSTINVFSLNSKCIEDVLDILKEKEENFVFSELHHKKENEYFLEASSKKEKEEMLTFFRIIFLEDKFYAISFSFPEKNILENFLEIEHILQSLEEQNTN